MKASPFNIKAGDAVTIVYGYDGHGILRERAAIVLNTTPKSIVVEFGNGVRNVYTQRKNGQLVRIGDEMNAPDSTIRI